MPLLTVLLSLTALLRPLSAHNGAVACYYVSTVGKDEEAVRKYIKEQEAADRQWDQLKLGEQSPPLGGLRICCTKPL